MDDRLADLRERADSCGIFLDFDGVLAEIVRDPASSTPVDGAADAIQLLAKRFALVAIVSGRPVSFLADRLGHLEHVRMRGLYGLQKLQDGRVVEEPRAAKWRSVVAEGATTAEAELPKDIRVERKGLSFVLHYRGAPEMAAAAQEWGARFSSQSGLDAHQARLAIEIGPFLDFDKGSVVRELSVGLSGAAVFGDDNGDIPMFEAAKMRANTFQFSSVCVAVASSESPKALLEAADLTLANPTQVVELLNALAS